MQVPQNQSRSRLRFGTSARLAWAALVFITFVAGAAGLLGGGSPAGASHIAGAIYTGTHSGGGTMEFQVSADWKTITRFKFSRVPIPLGVRETCYVTLEPVPAGGLAIADHAFSYQTTEGSGTASFSGSFATSQQATGSFELNVGTTLLCENRLIVSSRAMTSGAMTWTATTASSPPPPSPPPLSGPITQKARSGKVVILAGCAMPCALTATGTVAVPGVTGTLRTGSLPTRVFPLRKGTASLDNPGSTRLSLSIPSRALKTIDQALAEGKRVAATVRVEAAYDSGKALATRGVRLKR